MSSDEPASALKEAEAWLVSAKHTLAEAQEDEGLSSVCCAQAIHGIIRANDALALKFLGVKTTRHDDAPVVYAKLIREGKIAKKDEGFKSLLAKAMRDKSGADYGKKKFRLEEAEEYVEKAEEFVHAAKKYIE